MSEEEKIDYICNHEKMEDPLKISHKSLFELETELKEFPKKSGELQRAYSIVTKEVNRLTTSLKIITAQMLERVVKRYEDKGQKVSINAKDTLRKTEIYLEPEWQEVQKQLDEASSQQSYLYGLCMSMNAKSHRLTELVNMATKYRYDELYVPQQNNKFEEMATIDGMDMEK